MKILSKSITPRMNASTIQAKNTTFNAAPEVATGIIKSAACLGPIVLAMLPNIKKNAEDDGLPPQAPISPLGEYPLNLSFPAEFSKKNFIEWASINRFGYEVRDDAVEFKDKEGHIIRRIVPEKNDATKVHIDRIWIYEDGQETAKFVKYADKDLKYYYDRDTDGTYMNSAELRSDGYWYDREGRIMQFDPITNEPQAGYKRPDNSLGESLTNPSFPEFFDVEDFKEWAKSLGLPAPVIEDGVAKFYNYEDKLVRQITEHKRQKGKVQDDYIWIYDNNGLVVGKYAKYYMSKTTLYKYGRTENGGLRYTAQLGEDGLWHPFGRDWDEILPINPVTGEPQCPKD